MRQLSKSQNKRYKKEQKESYLHKLTTKYNKPTYVFAQKETKGILLFILAIGLFFIPTYGYYNNIYLPSLPHPQNHDPFTTLWNGQIPSTFSTLNPANPIFAGNFSRGGLPGTLTITTSPQDFIGASFISTAVVGFSTFAISDSQGNTWTFVGFAGNNPTYAYTVTPLSGSDVITFSCNPGGCTASGKFGLDVYHNVLKVGNTAQDFNGVGATSGTSILSITTQVSNDVVWNPFGISPNGSPSVCSTITPNSGQTLRSILSNCPSTFFNQQEGFDKAFPSTGSQSLSMSWTCNGTSCSYDHVAIELQPNTKTLACEQVGYHCFNSQIKTGNINLNSTTSGNALTETQSFIDLSTGVNKSIAFGELHSLGLQQSGKEIAWFLTTNGTMITSNSTINASLNTYNPLNDTSVSMEVLEVWTSTSVVNYYVYMQRASGQVSRITGLSDNPYSNGLCPQSSTIFLCTLSTKGSNANDLSLTLNYTGNNIGSNSGNGQSYLCIDVGAGSTTCNLGGVNNVQVFLANTNFIINYTQPWINIQQKYYLGFWSLSPQVASSPVIIDTSNTASTFSPVVSLYSPSGSSKTQGFDYFGWIGSAIGTWWGVKVASTCATPIIQNICQAPQNIESSFIAAILLVVNGLAIGVRIFFNGIGNALSLGNLGDLLILYFSGITAWLVGVSGAAFGQLGNIATQAVSLMSLATSFLTFTNLSNLVIQFLSNIGLTIPLLNTLFNDSITLFSSFSQFATFMFFVWYLWLGVAIYFRGLSGVTKEFQNMKEFLSFLFRYGYYFADASWTIALFIKQMITGWL